MKTETIYFFTLDELREDADMSIADFIVEICSLRQYWRYKKGESLCPQSRFCLFLKRMKLTMTEFENYFFNIETYDFNNIGTLYTHILNNNYNDSSRIINTYKNHHFVNFENELFYDVCVILFENQFTGITDASKLDKYYKFLNYPSSLKKKFVTYRDIVILLKIAEIEIKMKKLTAIEHLYETIFEHKIYLSGSTRYFMPSIYVKLVKLFGIEGNYDKALKTSVLGIKYSIATGDSSALPNLYFLSALSKKKLGIYNNCNCDLAKCLMSALSSHSVSSYNIFYKLIRKEFGYTDDTIIKIINIYLSSTQTKKTVTE